MAERFYQHSGADKATELRRRTLFIHNFLILCGLSGEVLIYSWRDLGVLGALAVLFLFCQRRDQTPDEVRGEFARLGFVEIVHDLVETIGVGQAVTFADESPFPSVEAFMQGLQEYVYAPSEPAAKGD